jgi:hypothetical protein
MPEITLSSAAEAQSALSAALATAQQPCDECMGSGGWFRYEPALEPSPGLLYLSCLQCRGSGSPILARG